MRWIGSDEAINQLVAGLPSWGLLVLLAVCIVVLSKGADLMVDGAVSLARRTGLPRIVIGATIISLGTTTPEMFVSVLAAWTGNPGLALGNGVGSIICDTGLIFGLMCLMSRVPVRRFILNRTGWVAGGRGHPAGGAVPDRPVGRSGGPPPWAGGGALLLLLLLAAYLYMSYRWARQSGLPWPRTRTRKRSLGPVGRHGPAPCWAWRG